MSQQTQIKNKFAQIESVNSFRQHLLQALAKLGDPSCVKTAQEEVAELLREHTTNQERLNLLVYQITEFNDSMKNFHRKELMKVLGLAAETLEEKLVPFLPKILQFYGKRVKDADNFLHQPLAEAMAAIVHHLLKNLDDPQARQEALGLILKQMYQSIASSNKIQQACASLCFTRALQSTPEDLLKANLARMTQKLAEFLSHPSIKCKSQLLESIMALNDKTQHDFAQYTHLFLSQLIGLSGDQDFTIRKNAVDTMTAFARMHPQTLKPFKRDIVDVLQEIKFDKMKPVREASNEALAAMKEVPGIEGQEQPDEQDQKLQKKASLEKERKQMRKPRFIDNSEKREVRSLSKERKGQDEGVIPAAQQEDHDRKVSKATQKRRENKEKYSKLQQLIVAKREMEPHQSIFEAQKNQGFFSQENKEIELFLKPDQKFGGAQVAEADSEQESDDQNQPSQSAKYNVTEAGGHFGREVTNEYQFPQLTTIPAVNEQQEHFEDGTVLLSEEQRVHFLKQEKRQVEQELEIKEEADSLESERKPEPRDGAEGGSIQPYQPAEEEPQFFSGQQKLFQYQMQKMQAPPVLSLHQQKSLNYILFELEKIGQQQARMIESMNTFQNYARTELGGLRQRVHNVDLRLGQCYAMRNNMDPGKMGRGGGQGMMFPMARESVASKGNTSYMYSAAKEGSYWAGAGRDSNPIYPSYQQQKRYLSPQRSIPEIQEEDF